MTKPTASPARPTRYLVLFTVPLRSQSTLRAPPHPAGGALTLWSESVSRILFRFCSATSASRRRASVSTKSGDGHSSRRRIAPRAQATYPETVARPASRACAGTHRTGSPDNVSLFGLAPRRVCLATWCRHPCWWSLTLRASRPTTVSPITCAPKSHRLVYSLLHLSSGRPAWPLASPLPCGVRTFLSPAD